jgi:hypothetical protein
MYFNNLPEDLQKHIWKLYFLNHITDEETNEEGDERRIWTNEEINDLSEGMQQHMWKSHFSNHVLKEYNDFNKSAIETIKLDWCPVYLRWCFRCRNSMIFEDLSGQVQVHKDYDEMDREFNDDDDYIDFHYLNIGSIYNKWNTERCKKRRNLTPYNDIYNEDADEGEGDGSDGSETWQYEKLMAHIKYKKIIADEKRLKHIKYQTWLDNMM